MATSKKVELEDNPSNGTTSSNDCCEYPQILRERKAERRRSAEEKRLDTLSLIRERNLRTGIHPLEQFPKEIWVEILSYLNPQDKANLWEIHPLFRGLMGCHHIRDILFPLMLDYNTRFIENYFDHFLSYSDVLEMRCVAQSLRNAVDEWFEKDLSKFWETPQKDSWRILKNLRWGAPNKVVEMDSDDDDLDDHEDVVNIEMPMKIFQKDFCISVWDASASAMILDKSEPRRYLNRFVEKVTETLGKVGDQIWRFEFYSEDIHRYGITPSELYSFMSEWLSHLPNLRFLDICFNVTNSDWKWDDYEAEQNDECLPNIEFPLLHDLKRFDFGTPGPGDNILDGICDAIIVANRHIKFFNYHGYDFTKRMCQPNVQSLELESCRIGLRELDEIKEIILNSTSNWNLNVIELRVLALAKAINSFFQLLNRIPTLEYVSLDIDKINFDEENKIDFLRLPNLVHFGLKFQEIEKKMYSSNIHFFLSLHFLLYSSKLKSLKWVNAFPKSMSTLNRHIKFYEQQHTHEMLDFGGGFGKIQIMGCFPKTGVRSCGMQIINRREEYLPEVSGTVFNDMNHPCDLKVFRSDCFCITFSGLNVCVALLNFEICTAHVHCASIMNFEVFYLFQSQNMKLHEQDIIN